jgi:hypothetical protein
VDFHSHSGLAHGLNCSQLTNLQRCSDLLLLFDSLVSRRLTSPPTSLRAPALLTQSGACVASTGGGQINHQLANPPKQQSPSFRAGGQASENSIRPLTGLSSPPSLKILRVSFASQPSIQATNHHLLFRTTSSSRTPTQLPPQPKKIIGRSPQDTKPSHFPLLPLLPTQACRLSTVCPAAPDPARTSCESLTGHGANTTDPVW